MTSRRSALIVATALAACPAAAQQATQTPAPAVQQPAPITTEQQWIAALQSTLRTVQMPSAIEQATPPGRYSVRLSFKVARDGTISAVNIVQGSARPDIDDLATTSLQGFSPLAPFPQAMAGDIRSFVVPFAFIVPEPVAESAAPVPPPQPAN